MNLLRPALLFWVCILSLLGAATAGAQTQPLVASFEFTPANPVANEPVTLIDTTKNPTSAKLEYAWDLDADDQFDDSTSMAVTHPFPAGPHRVSLRVRRIGTTTQTDTETRTIVVTEAPTPTVTPTPTATATTEPDPTPAPTIKAPKLNLPPVAGLARQCATTGTTELCLGPLVRLGKPKTFDASESVDHDGTIVRYQWDLDGNGVFDIDTGAGPKLTTTITDERKANLRLRVTDDDGATADAAMALTKLEPECQAYVKFDRVYATSPCLRAYPLAHGTQYRSRFPVSVNGITVDPVSGQQVRINITGSGLLRRYEIVSGKAVASFPFKGQHIVIQKGPVRWTIKDHQLQNTGSLNGRKLNGLEITGAPEDTIDLPVNGVSQIKVYLKLPSAFGAPTSDKPVILTAGSPKPDLTGGIARAKAASADEAFAFEVGNASVGPIALDGLKVSYDGDGLWDPLESTCRHASLSIL